MSKTDPTDTETGSETETAPAPKLAADRRASLGHRPEIDGLRAIAVLAVVFYHFSVPGFGGGFVGVDVFFVISGFLIGGILWHEQQDTGRLALGKFYLRRIRRLAPAYYVMCLTVLAVGAFVLLPNDYREAAKGIIAATVYLSNVLFFRQSGYFDGSSEDKVMLHTWSLSVEEQFYIFLPLLFLLFARNKTVMLWALGAVFGLSFLSNLITTPLSQPASFFLFPFRAWELLAGVGLAIVSIERPDLWRKHQALSWAGLALVLASVVFVVPGNSFPGWQVLFPVLGTVLLIGNGQDDNWVNRGLSLRVPVLIGLMSYSLYLWHWPVFTMTKYLQGAYRGPSEVALWIAVSFVLAALSWRLVEQPVRQAKNIPTWSLVFTTVVGAISLLGLAFTVFKADGMPNRFGPQAQVHIQASGDFLQDFSACEVPSDGPFAGLEVCPIGPEAGARNLVIWGDSHVRAYYEGLKQAAREANRSALVIWRAGCAPVFDVEKRESAATPAQDAACAQANAQIREALNGMSRLKDVILIGRWSYYATGTGSGSDAHNTIRLRSDVYGPMTQDALLGAALSATAAEIANKDRSVYVLRQPPEIQNYNAPQVAQDLVHGRLSEQVARRLGQITVTNAKTRESGAAAALAQSGAHILDPWPFFCDPFLCDAVHNGVGQYFDNNHVTNSAARRMRSVFYPVMARSAP